MRKQRGRLYIGSVCLFLIVIILALIITIAVRGAEVIQEQKQR